MTNVGAVCNRTLMVCRIRARLAGNRTRALGQLQCNQQQIDPLDTDKGGDQPTHTINQ